MSKKTRNLKPDTILKNYWSDNEQFADFFNAVLFEGKQVIQAEELEEVDTEESTIFEHREYAESLRESRDNVKIRKRSSVYGIELVLLGMEGQEHIHYAMPMRIMGYDYGSYKKQYDSNAKKYKTAQGMETDEYLSRMKKTDKLIPVITVVVYYGEKPWDGARRLHEMLDLPEEMKKYVNDYKMLLVEARKNELALHNLNNIDLFNLLEIFLNSNRPLNEIKNRAIEYATEHHVDSSVIMTAAGAANCKLNYNQLKKRRDVDMCTVFEATWEEGRAEGRTEGIVNAIKLLDDMNVPSDEIIRKVSKQFAVLPEKVKEIMLKETKIN